MYVVKDKPQLWIYQKYWQYLKDDDVIIDSIFNMLYNEGSDYNEFLPKTFFIEKVYLLEGRRITFDLKSYNKQYKVNDFSKTFNKWMIEQLLYRDCDVVMLDIYEKFAHSSNSRLSYKYSDFFRIFNKYSGNERSLLSVVLEFLGGIKNEQIFVTQ